MELRLATMLTTAVSGYHRSGGRGQGFEFGFSGLGHWLLVLDVICMCETLEIKSFMPFSGTELCMHCCLAILAGTPRVED